VRVEERPGDDHRASRAVYRVPQFLLVGLA
jgi:hypothetical protein